MNTQEQQINQEQTQDISFLNQPIVEAPKQRQRRVCKPRTAGIFGTASKTLNSGLSSVGDSAEVIARTVGLANLQLKATHLEIELEIYEDIMERGYSLEEAKQMLADV